MLSDIVCGFPQSSQPNTGVAPQGAPPMLLPASSFRVIFYSILILCLMFCWPCIIVYQYNETNVTHFSFNLLRIKGLSMLRTWLIHLQETLHKRHLVYCARMSVGCGTIAVSLQPWHSQLTYILNIPSAVCAASPEDEQVIFVRCRGPWFSINWMKIASRWFHYTD
jgi:hypothetical protein